jgi:hypothetical protein
MNRKIIVTLLFCAAMLALACQPTQKASVKADWKITFGTVSNQPLPPQAQAADYLRRAIDGTVNTYWQSQAEAHAGMYLELDLVTSLVIRGVVLDTSPKELGEDYPRGMVVYGATKAGEWKELFRDYNPKPVDGKIHLEFPPTEVRYLRLQLLGGVPNKWWSVAEIDLQE